MALHYFGFATGLRRARQEDLAEAKRYMRFKTTIGIAPSNVEAWKGQVWNHEELDKYIQASPEKVVVLIDGFAIDVTLYLSEHVWHCSSYYMHLMRAHNIYKPGGAGLLRKYSTAAKGEASHSNGWSDASWAFGGGLNNHSRAARRRMQELRLAKIHT